MNGLKRHLQNKSQLYVSEQNVDEIRQDSTDYRFIHYFLMGELSNEFLNFVCQKYRIVRLSAAACGPKSGALCGCLQANRLNKENVINKWFIVFLLR